MNSVSRAVRRLLLIVAAGIVLGACENRFFTSGPEQITISTNDEFFLDGSQWYLRTVHAPQAWQLVAETLSRGTVDPVRVAVIDTVPDVNHEDFRNVFTDDGYDFIDRRVITEASEYQFEGADVAHGTHVAGLIGARGGNGIGISGTAFNGFPRVIASIIPIRILNSNGDGRVSDLVEAILYVAGRENSSGLVLSQPASIINLSLGSASLVDPNLHSAIQVASDAGIVIIAAAGNEGNDRVHNPAGYPEVIAVGSVDQDTSRSGFSNFGPELELVAPGGVRKISDQVEVEIISTVPGHAYDYKQGTSMAAPIVAGVAAMVRAVNPALTAPEVRAILQETAIDLGAPGRDDQFGYGLVDARAAVLAAMDTRGGTVRRRSIVSVGVAESSGRRRSPGTGAAIGRWDPEADAAIAVLLDEEWMIDNNLVDGARYLRQKLEGSLPGYIPFRGRGLLVRADVPEGLDGSMVLETIGAIPGVLSVAQDRMVTWF